MLTETLGGAPVEEVGVELEQAVDVVAGVDEEQREVELGGAAVHVEGAKDRRLVSAGTGRGGSRRLQCEHGLEERRATEVTLRLELLDELLEGDVLMRVGAEGGLAHLGEQLAEGHVQSELGAKREGVDEEADDAFELGLTTVGDGRADDDVVLSGVAGEEDVEGGQQHHEGSHTLAAAEGAKRGGEVRAEAHGEVGAVSGLDRRTGPVGGQLQGLRSAGEVLSPPGDLLGQGFVAQPAALPGGVVGVLERERSQRRRQALAEGGVELNDFAPEDTRGPTVGDDVVDGDEQHVALLGETHEGGAEQRRVSQLEGLLRLRGGEALGLGVASGFLEVPEVDVGKGELDVGEDALSGLAIGAGDEAGAQGLVATDQLVEGAGEGVGVQLPVDLEGGGDVVEGAVGLEPVEEPQALLGEGEGQVSGASHGRQGRELEAILGQT